MITDWLLLGLAGGGAAAAFIAVIFFTGSRLYPTSHKPGTFSGEHKRRSEIREYLSAIGEQFAEDHPVCGQSVEFYLPKRDVAITFDARAYFRIDGSPTYAVLVEHEMPGTHLGARLPFETPQIESRDDATNTAFALLGLPTTADTMEVKQAYRERVKDVHPDHGGDQESFKRLREAYTTAKKRAS